MSKHNFFSFQEHNLGNIVDQLCTSLQDIKDHEDSVIGMPTCSIEQAEAVRQYYAAFPALKKGQESPLQYYLPPPAWCRKTVTEVTAKMQCELSPSKDWSLRNKKFVGKERRNSYHGQRRNRKRSNGHNRSFESKDSLPEWVTYEGVWDMETQDPVKEFIRAIALDEGYGTCENTITDDIRNNKPLDNAVPDWDDGLDLDTDWVLADDLEPRTLSPADEELYAKFEAKFDRSIEALWDQNTPDDEYQDLPIDFHDLLSSPSDLPPPEKKSLPKSFENLTFGSGSLTLPVEAVTERLRPLHIADPAPAELDSFALYEGEDIYEALAAVADTMRSFTAINHSRDTSGFVEVPPRRGRAVPPPAPLPPAGPVRASESAAREDLLTSARTHFRPIRRESDAEAPRYVDGDTFDIRGDLDPVEERRSPRGGVYVAAERYLEYRGACTIRYGRLNLTAAQRCPDLEEVGLRLRFPLRQRNAAVQTERLLDSAWECEECGAAAKKMRGGDERVWGEARACTACSARAAPSAPPPPPLHADLSREWEELLSDISAAHARYAAGEPEPDEPEESPRDRKRRHSAALRCAPACTHPHARFLACCALALDRPLTR